MGEPREVAIEDRGEVAPRTARSGYLAQSRDLLTSLVVVLPLLLVYQAGLLWTHGATLNGVDFVTVFVVQRFGAEGLLGLNAVLILAGLVGVYHLRRTRRFDARIVLPMAVESTIYALLLGVVITLVMSRMGIRPPLAVPALAIGDSALASFFLALGAGVNEELVFRLGLFSALAAGLRRVAPPGTDVLGAVALSSLLFSLAHYLGPESFELYSFVYRFLAGALFCGLFVVRGFGIAVYTHAIYDVYVMIWLGR